MLANFSQRFVLSDFGVKFIRDSRGNFKLQGATFFTLNLHLLSSYWHFYGMCLRCTEHNRAMPICLLQVFLGIILLVMSCNEVQNLFKKADRLLVSVKIS